MIYIIRGFKCFNSDLTNRYGVKFEVGKTYRIDGKITFGITGNGFHFCKNIEDTFRYYDTFNDDVCVCQVTGNEKYLTYSDDYYGYYDMYSVEYLTINKICSREEIINMGINLNRVRVIRFIQGYDLTDIEIKLFKEKFKSDELVLNAISYYQEGNKEVYNRKVKRI